SDLTDPQGSGGSAPAASLRCSHSRIRGSRSRSGSMNVVSEVALEPGKSSRASASLYARLEAALAMIAESQARQPSLEEVAAAAGMSPFHFQRVFARWVGISPKRFLQYLTLDYAKARLTEAASVLDAAYDAGLSGPGRLHDLFVTHEAITPGHFKRRGEGLRIVYGVAGSARKGLVEGKRGER